MLFQAQENHSSQKDEGEKQKEDAEPDPEGIPVPTEPGERSNSRKIPGSIRRVKEQKTAVFRVRRPHAERDMDFHNGISRTAVRRLSIGNSS